MSSEGVRMTLRSPSDIGKTKMLTNLVYQSIISKLDVARKVNIGGLWGSSAFFIIAQLYLWLKNNSFVIVVPDSDSVEPASDDISAFLSILTGERNYDILINTEDVSEVTSENIHKKVLFLKNMLGNRHKIVISDKESLSSQVPLPYDFNKSIVELRKHQSIKRDELVNKLLACSYTLTKDLVREYSEIAVRGGILDVFPYGEENPIRIEWNGNTIESIRYFYPDSQLSIPLGIENICIHLINTTHFTSSPPGSVSLRTGKGLLDYLPDNTIIAFIEQQINSGNIRDSFTDYKCLYLYQFPIPEDDGFNLNIQSLQRFGGGFTNILKELQELLSRTKQVYIFSQNKSEETHLKELLASNNFEYPSGLKFYQGKLQEGFLYNNIKTGFISHNELFNRYRLLRRPKPFSTSYRGEVIEQFIGLERGDFAVHTSYGIGRYLGLKRLYHSEFLTLEYQDKSFIYVPILQMYEVSKYWGAGRGGICLDKIGSTAWANRKARVQNAVSKLARDLLHIQALRFKSKPASARYSPDSDWQNDFQNAFPYEETPDQTSISVLIKEKMLYSVPMDYLICGDVGYGKTELAMRGAFRATLSEKQTALIAPTTILAEQHYRTFSERMADYPVIIEVISRFKSKREQQDILKRLSQGKIDIIIGTHRLLQNDVRFKNLGLVIIDEEQRFGVEHKEYLKRMKTSVDVLTLSATPIPRTLHLALSGLRDIATMTIPPQGRRAIKTVVSRFDSNIIKEGILREIERKGQVYFVHNRVFDIDQVADKIRAILPLLSNRIVIAHGQMPGYELEQKMRDFIDGKYDILVSTNIIESGLDIPRVNTIFINNVDDFGLSDLHQLRGRVGRYTRQAYAYFLIPPNERISTDGLKRLKAIEEFNELGAGFKIAMRDMEIRGVGNILGREQHGHITAVGYELYCKLLEKAVRQIKIGNIHPSDPAKAGRPASRPKTQDARPMMQDTIDAFIPEKYIPSEKERLLVYRRLSLLQEVRQIDTFEYELQDCFGKPIPEPTRNLLKLARSRIGKPQISLSG